MNKYRNKKTAVGGVVFDSRKEARRYQELQLLERAGEIQALALQRRYELSVNGEKICDYVADFDYYDVKLKKLVTEDAKGIRTPVYRLKKKLMKAIRGIEIQEV